MATTGENIAGSTGITLATTSLANGSARESAVVDNSGTVYDEVQVLIKPTIAAGGVLTGQVLVYVAATLDGSIWSGNATGGQADTASFSPTNLALLGVVGTPSTAGGAFSSLIMSIKKALGQVPLKWTLIVVNQSGAAMNGIVAEMQGFKENIA